MGVFQVRVTTADMRDDNGVFAFERAKQLIRSVDGLARGLPFDQDMRRAPNRTSFVAVKDIPIAAHAGVARPFVSRKANKPAWSVELSRQAVEFLPELVGDLEVIALVTDHVDESSV